MARGEKLKANAHPLRHWPRDLFGDDVSHSQLMELLDYATKNELLGAIAHHEAGHAVAAHIGGLYVDRATILPDKDSSGSVRIQLPPTLFDGPVIDIGLLKQRAIGLWAGPEAEYRYWTRRGVELTWDGGKKDHDDLVNIMDQLRVHTGNQSRWLLKYRRKAEDLVVTHWSEIESLAEALLKHKTLTRKQIKHALDW